MTTRRSLAYSFLDRYSGLVLSIGSSMAISRLLMPAEIGVFSLAMGFLAVVQTLRDFGAGQYLLQERELTPDRIRATWTVQLGLGILLTAVTLAAAYPVSQFYGEPQLQNVFWVVALNSAVMPFGSLTYAWLMRELRFELIAIMRFAGSLVSATTSILLAWWDFGAISLAYGSLAGSVATALVGTWYRPRYFPWLPGVREIRRVMNFGSKFSITSLLRTAAGSAPELVLGKSQGMIDVGLYSRANGLVAMFNRLFLDATHTVAIAKFGETHRQNAPIAPVLSQFTSALIVIGWSFFGMLAVNADVIVHILYGSQWDASVLPIRILCLAGAFLLPHAFFGAALMATGRVDAVLRATVIDTAQRIILVAAGGIGGLHTLAAAIAASSLGGYFIWQLQLQRTLGIGSRQALHKLHLAIAITIVVTGLVFAIRWLCSLWHLTDYLAFALAIAGGCSAFLIMIHVTKHELSREVGRLIALISQKLQRLTNDTNV